MKSLCQKQNLKHSSSETNQKEETSSGATAGGTSPALTRLPIHQLKPSLSSFVLFCFCNTLAQNILSDKLFLPLSICTNTCSIYEVILFTGKYIEHLALFFRATALNTHKGIKRHVNYINLVQKINKGTLQTKGCFEKVTTFNIIWKNTNVFTPASRKTYVNVS